MSMQKTKSLSQLEMKMKLKSLRRHVEIVSQENILHHSTKPASLLWLLLLSASFCLTPLFVHDLLFSPHVRFLMLVPKSGKAEGMTRPPSTSHLTPCLPHFTPLPSPWTPVTINIMTLWSSVIHICMFDY